ncbi:MAG: aminotransferase, partial [Saprospiraceae bacterium]
RQRQAVAFRLLEMLGCSFERKQQGMFVWAKIPDRYADGYALSDELLYSRDLFLTPGGIFGSNGDRYIRISLCSPAEVLEQGLERLSESMAIKSTI